MGNEMNEIDCSRQPELFMYLWYELLRLRSAAKTQIALDKAYRARDSTDGAVTEDREPQDLESVVFGLLTEEDWQLLEGKPLCP